jgi:hypothetical protein
MAKDAKPVAGQGLQKPLCFVENKGQVMDGNKQVRKDIGYKLSTPGVNLFVGNGRLHYQFQKIENSDAANLHVTGYKMDVALLGANPNATAIASDEQQYYENYYLGNNEGFTAHSFHKVMYKNVYPHIDWVVYVKNNQVEYDFVVRPGGDVNNIKISYTGATNLSIASDGTLAAETPMGKITEHKPYSYETATGKEVASAFVLDGNIVSFKTGAHNGSLTIDPYLAWSTYYGGTAEDVAVSIKQSNGGLVYVGGYSASTTLGFTGPPGLFDAIYNGGAYDAFLTSFTAAGVRVWTTYFGGTGIDQAKCIALDNTSASVYLAGYTTSSGLATTFQLVNNGLNEGFLAKFNTANGARLWSTYFGGPGNDVINGVTVDAVNNVYMVGTTESSTSIAGAGAYQAALSGTTDAFAAKFTTAGAITWATYYGGTAQETGNSITVDGSSNVIITGQTNSVVNIATAGAHQEILGGTNDAYIAKLNSTATALTWGSYFGGPGLEEGKGVLCNTATNEVVMVGNTSSTSGIAGPRSQQPTYGGGLQDAYLASFNGAGAISWSTYYGGSDIEYGEGLGFDQFRNILVTGGTFSANGISTPGSFQSAIGGNYDAFVAKYTNRGQRIWGTYFGNAQYDYAFGVSSNAAGEVAIAGHTTSTAGIATIGAQQTAYGGGVYDCFITKFVRDTFVTINQPYIDTLVCAGGTFNLPYSTNINFATGNTFTAQLSNASGSFAAPIAIGSITSSASGSIPVTIPAGTAPGTGYRIRIVASNPSFISPDNFVNIEIVTSLTPPTATGNTPVCVGGDIYLDVISTYSISSYSWTGPSGTGFSSIIKNPVITGVSTAYAGTYSVVTTHNGCPSTTATVNIVVNSFIPPTPTVTATSVNCVGGTISLSAASGLGTAPVTYGWTGPSGFTSTLQNPSISPAALTDAGVYNVVDTFDGCPSAAASVTITVTPTTPVSVSISVSPNDTVCSGTMVTFTASAVNGGISPIFQWMTTTGPVVGAISSTWSTSTLTDGMSVYALLNSSITCPSPASAVSNVIKMNVINTPPLAFITASPGTSVPSGTPVTFTAAIFNGGVSPIYQWQKNGVDIPGATNSTYTSPGVTAAETIRLKLKTTMACATPDSVISNELVVHTNTGVDEVSSVWDNIELFPNPNNGSFTIKGDLQNPDINNVSVEVFNPLGQIIYSGQIEVYNSLLDSTLSMQQMPAGVYLLRISGDGRNKTVRFTIQH